MSKVVLDTVTGGYALSVINDNFQKVEDALNNQVLYRDNVTGEPNAMSDDLDMNSKRIYNLPSPSLPNEAARLKDVQDAISGATNANVIQYDPAGTGAVSTNVQAKLRESVTITDKLPTGFNTANDATAYVQLALDSGAKVVDFLGLALKCDSVTVPAGVWAKNVNLTKFTSAAGNIVLVNTGCTVSGKISGTGLVSAVQRCIYPSGDGVTDVCLNIEVTNATYGVHAQYLTSDTDANRPKRWTGFVYVHDIVGTVATSEGYGLLLSPADSCTFTVKAKNIRRHAIYLSAGASFNDVDMDCDGCGNYAAQVAAASPQQPCQYNRLTLRSRNLTTDVAGQSGILALTGRSHYNTIVVDCVGNATTYEAVRIEGSNIGTVGDYPLGNKIIDGTISGQFTGGDVIRLLNADGTIVSGNRIDAYGTVSVIASRRTGTNLSTHGGFVFNNTVNAQGQAIKGIYAEVNTVPTFIGINDIRNNGAALRVDDATGGKRQGFSRRVTFSGTTANITTLASGDTTVTLPDNIQTASRSASVQLSGSSVQFFNKPFWSAVTNAPSETQATVRIYNGHSVDQTFNYYGAVEGD